MSGNKNNPTTGSGKLLAGIDQLLSQTGTHKNLRIALLTNQAAVTTTGTPTRLALMQHDFRLVKLFSPEHGLQATGEDGAFQEHSKDGLTGLPIISLYGDRLAPTKDDLRDIDLVMVDIPDVGCRFYTYLWTMTHVMESCAAYGVPLLIADRPNPIGGNLQQAEGPMLDEEHCASFIGRWHIPIRHSCTLGELARYFAATRIKGLQLQVVPVHNWQRQQLANDLFTPTSPAIRRQATALLYPGMGLLEGINLNEGRGTATPFEMAGAPWIDAGKLQAAFAALQLPGISTSPTRYTPTAGLYAGEICKGLAFTVTAEDVFRPVATGIAFIRCLCKLYPAQVAERLYPTVANPGGGGHLDRLMGIPNALETIQKDEMLSTNIAREWPEMIGSYLLYSR